MPVIGSFAAGSARGYGQFSGVSSVAAAVSASFVGSKAFNTSGSASTTVQYPAGTQAGDVVLIVAGFSGFVATAATTNKSGWTNTSYFNDPGLGYYATFFTKTIVADDLTGMTISPADASGQAYCPFLTVVFRGPVSFSVNMNSAIPSGSASFSQTGITKTSASQFVMAIINDRSAGTETVGSGWTQLDQVTNGIFNITGAYRSSSSYTNGTTIPWTRTNTAYSAGNWTIDVTNSPGSVEYLVVAGGGGGGGGSVTGGYTGGGGGGAGGLRTGNVSVNVGTSLTVTVGGGGSAGGTNGFGSNGTSSVFGTITSVGGGGGGHGGGAWIGGTGAYGFSGGSGGGSGYRATFAGAGTTGQGNNGGSAGSGEQGSGGGGGAGAVGVNGNISPAQYTGGNGGIGIFSSFSGSNTAYAGGGGAGGLGTSGYDGRGGFGGEGGGGNGSGVLGDYTTSANNANTNSGGGGGGGSRRVDGGTPGGGGSGGSGIVIIRYPATFADAASTTGTPTYTNSGGFKIYTWTGSGTITF